MTLPTFDKPMDRGAISVTEPPLLAETEVTTSAQVLDALRGHWPPSEYLMVEEAPQDSMRQGRKLDALIVSTWKSRGHELDGVEVKVSMSDWRRELKEASKADWWWAHVHRFWIAVPAKIAPKVRAELPTGWGLLAVSGAGCTVVVKPERHAPEPLTWPVVVGVMRALSGCGANALAREHEKGRSQGYREAEARLERQSGDARLRGQLDDLRAKVAAFAETSGVDLQRTYSDADARRIGELYTLMAEWSRDPTRVAEDLVRHAGSIEAASKTLRAIAESLKSPPGNDPSPVPASG